MSVLGVNVSPTGSETYAQVVDSGASIVRLVLRGDVHVREIVQGYRNGGMSIIGVYAKESIQTCPDQNDPIGWYANQVGDLLYAFQVGNEPDQVGPSSWTLPLGTIGQMGSSAWHRFPRSVKIVMGGLASGDPNYLDTDRGSDWPWNGIFEAICVHPYTQRPSTILSFIQGYRAKARGLPIWATEFAWYDGIARILCDMLPVSLVYNFQDWPGWLNGLVDMYGHPKPWYVEFQALAKVVNRVATTDELQAQIKQLQEQQSIQTDALAAIGKKRYRGPGSLEALVRRLSPVTYKDYEALDPFP